MIEIRRIRGESVIEFKIGPQRPCFITVHDVDELCALLQQETHGASDRGVLEQSEFGAKLVAEVRRARAKFPSGKDLIPALMEECGELARELLQNGNTPHARVEAIQVAATAMRIATEGAVEFNNMTEEQRQR